MLNEGVAFRKFISKEFYGDNYSMDIAAFNNGVYYYTLGNSNNVNKGSFVIVK